MIVGACQTMRLNTERIFFWVIILKIPPKDIAIRKRGEQELTIKSKMAITVQTR
jgi:hypothetical protein